MYSHVLSSAQIRGGQKCPNVFRPALIKLGTTGEDHDYTIRGRRGRPGVAGAGRRPHQVSPASSRVIPKRPSPDFIGEGLTLFIQSLDMNCRVECCDAEDFFL